MDSDLDLDDEIYLYNFSNEFSQALINILNNASDAINSKLTIDELRLIKITTKQLKNSVEITIQDNAGGINQKVIDKIFEPYFTTKHQFQGTGLGLSIVKELLLQMWSEIHLTSNIWKWSTFSFRFPIYKE